MEKLDYRKSLAPLYSPSAKVISTVNVPSMRFLMIDGAGDPNESEPFMQAMEALFTVSYTAKFRAREALGIDYGVMPPEGLWWMDDMGGFDMAARERWQWTLMIMQPEIVSPELLHSAIEKAGAKKPLPALPKMRIETYDEGMAAQTLHVGPFSDEGPTVQAIHGYIAASGHAVHGKHHEIYLSDFRRVAPEKWKTVIRQPMR